MKANSEQKLKLSYLIDRSEGEISPVSLSSDPDILSVEYDSRKVKEGSLFVAIEGYETDGHRFIEKAVKNGAVALVISDKKYAEVGPQIRDDTAVMLSSDTRRALSRLSAIYYNYPSCDIVLIGITGTNGKTSIAYMMESVLKAWGKKCGVIGTINYRWNEIVMPAANTTPESGDLHELISTMKNDGVEYVIMEVSSHALELNRADDLDFNMAIFTNLTGDHLDFHKNFEDYFKAKKRLFHILEKSRKNKRFALVNIDDSWGKKIYNEKNNYSYPFISFGLSAEALFKPIDESIVNAISGLSFVMEKPERGFKVALHLAGRFHIYNALAVISAMRALDISYGTIKRGLENLSTVPGRFDLLKSDAGFSVIVDYAHTEDALLKLLQSANELKEKRVISVFGCGGDRDKTKRPLMGKVAVENSDVVIVTSDNPRTEDPVRIINDIISDIDTSRIEVIPDREKAIGDAIMMAEAGDIVVIAGKGHEDYQIIGKEKIHFDDREVASMYLKKRMAQ